MTYRPRPQARRYRDGDCPACVLALYDNGGVSADRYTVIYRGVITAPDGSKWLGLRAMNSQPQHPQGIGLYAEYRVHEITAFRERSRRHAIRWTYLPQAVRDCITADAVEYFSTTTH